MWLWTVCVFSYYSSLIRIILEPNIRSQWRSRIIITKGRYHLQVDRRHLEIDRKFPYLTLLIGGEEIHVGRRGRLIEVRIARVQHDSTSRTVIFVTGIGESMDRGEVGNVVTVEAEVDLRAAVAPYENCRSEVTMRWLGKG